MSQTINVDMTPNSFQPSLYYSQGDIGREFKIKIVSQSGDTIPAGATVTIQATKPSGFGFSVAADSVTDGVATFTTTAEMTDEFGRFPAELKVVSGSVTIFSANFQMVGERNTHPEGTIDGQQGTIIPELTVLVERVEAAASSVLDMTVNATTLAAGSQATYSYDEDTNTATFGIPQGEAGAGAAGVTASAYSASKTYAVGEYVIHNSNLYRCTTAITTAEAFTAAHWTQVVLGDDVTDLKSDITQLQELDIVDMLDLTAFVASSSSFVSTDGYLTTVSSLDNRSESQISYTMPLQAGVKYAVVFDNVTSTSIRFQIYDAKQAKFAFNGYPTYANQGGALEFTPTYSGNYCLKIICEVYPKVIPNLRIVNYNLWRASEVTPNFISGYTDSECITHAIKSAYEHKFPKVHLYNRKTAYSVEEPIQMLSNVELECDTNAQLTLANNANCPMITNANATTGAIVDTDICISGGIWDGNHDNQDKWKYDENNQKEWLVVAFLFAGIKNFTIKNCKIKNARTYGVLIGNCKDVNLDNVSVNVGDVNNPDNGDGIHFLGPANNVRLTNIDVKSEDNCIAFNADDVDHGKLTTTGLISNIVMDNIIINNTDGGQGILLLSSSHAIKDVIINNVTGTSGYFLNVSNFGLDSNSGSYNGIVVTNVTMDFVGSWEHAVILAGIMRNIVFENICFTCSSWASGARKTGFYIRKFSNNNTQILSLTLNNIHYYGSQSNRTLYLIHIQTGAVVDNFLVSRYISYPNVCRCYPLVNYGAITNLTLSDCVYSGLYGGVIQMLGYASSINELNIDGVKVDSASAPRVQNVNGNTISSANISNMMDFEVLTSDVKWLNYPRRMSRIALPDDHIFYYAGDLITSQSGNGVGWKCTHNGTRFTTAWSPSTAVTKYAFRKLNGYLLRCVLAGTTGATEPTITEDGQIFDGTAEWIVYHGNNSATFETV